MSVVMVSLLAARQSLPPKALDAKRQSGELRDVLRFARGGRRSSDTRLGDATARAQSRESHPRPPVSCALLWDHPQVRAELLELLDVSSTQIDHVHRPLASHPDVPL